VPPPTPVAPPVPVPPVPVAELVVPFEPPAIEPDVVRTPEPAATPALADTSAGNGSHAPLFASTPLPRRVPQASLDPRMREAPRPVGAAQQTTVSGSRIGGRSPEELRARLSQFQAAQAKARQDTSATPATGRGEEQ